MLHCCVRYFLLLTLWFTGFVSVAQDAQFSQFFLTRHYLNPAFTGNTNMLRLSTHTRRQWPGLGGYSSTGAYADANFKGIRSGIGVGVFRDVQSEGALSFQRFSFNYAYGNHLNQKLLFRTGVGLTLNSVQTDLSQFTFTDQLITGSTTTSDNYTAQSLSYFDASMGALIYNKEFWVGSSLSNMRSLFAQSGGFGQMFPAKFSVHGGVLVPINKDAKGDFFRSMTIAAHYKAQGKYDQIDIGAYYGYSAIIVGMWYRHMHVLKNNQASPANHDALVLVFGIQYESLRIAYSYDISVSPLIGYSGGAHELGLQLQLWSNKKVSSKKNSRRFVPCPDFGPGWGS